MRCIPLFLTSSVLCCSSSLVAQTAVKQEVEVSAFYFESADGKAEAETDTLILKDSTRIRSGGSAPGIFRYNLQSDDWYFSADFYNLFISAGTWGGISLFKNGWGFNSEFTFGHGKSSSSLRTKTTPSTGSSSSSSSPSTTLAFGPAYLFQSGSLRVEAAIRYVLNKGSSTKYLDSYFDETKLTGTDVKIKLAQFHNLTDAIAWGYGLEVQRLLSAKAEIKSDFGTLVEMDVDEIAYMATTLYPVKLRLHF